MSKNKKMTTLSIIALAAFVAFSGLTALSVNQFSHEVSEKNYADENHIPIIWQGKTESSSISINTEVVEEGDHLSYVMSVANLNRGDSIFIKELAVYTSDSSHSGYLPFNSNSLEYSYVSDSEESWSSISGTTEKGVYKLDTPITLGSSGRSNNKVYFRYHLSPETGDVNGKLAVLVDAGGVESYASSDSTVAYQPVSTEVVARTEQPQDEASGESAFVEPLGATTSTLSNISTSSIAAITISPESMATSILIITIILGIFALSVAIYLILNHQSMSKKTTATKKSKK